MSRARSLCLTITLVIATACDGPDPATAPPSGLTPRRSTAATVVVTNTGDDPIDPGSLRYAIANAADGSTIQFDQGIAGGVITLTGPALRIESKALTIEGSATDGMTIRGSGTDNVFWLWPSGTAVLRNLTITGGVSPDGGGIRSGGTLTLDHSLVTGNTSTELGPLSGYGGGILNFGNLLTLINSTVSGNTAQIAGGGIADISLSNSTGKITLINSTVANNTVSGVGGAGGGLFFETNGTGRLTTRNSIIANNTAPSDVNCWFQVGLVPIHLGRSLSNDDTCGTGPSMLVANPALGPLVANSGPTLTHALLATSPAIDAVPTGECTVPDDQRYVARPQLPGGACDIGAFEFDAYVKIAIAVDVSVTVNPTTAIAVVSGTMTCGAPGQVGLEVTLSQKQKVGRVSAVVEATDVTTIDCSGTRYWSVALAPASGGFVTGSATASARTVSVPPSFAPATSSSAVRLYWGRR